jgi:hypothetical protein
MEIEELIKWIIGILVIVVVVVGVYLFFKNQVIDFFKNLSVGTPKIFTTLIK